jgi:hypothetical protein
MKAIQGQTKRRRQEEEEEVPWTTNRLQVASKRGGKRMRNTNKQRAKVDQYILGWT